MSRSAVCLLLADCLLFAILSNMDSLTQYKDVGYKKVWILTMSAVCLLSADCLHFAVLPLRHREKRGLLGNKVVGHEKWWFFSRSAVCLLLADCLLFAILSDRDSLTLGMKNSEFLPCQLFVYFQLIILNHISYQTS